MKTHNKLLIMASVALLPFAAQAQTMTKTETTTMTDGTKIVIKSTSDADAAAESMKISETTYYYDTNNDGFIGPNEYSAYVVRNYDANNDGYITEKEYNNDSMTYFYSSMANGNEKKAEVKNYTFWDKDKDNRLDASEVESMVANFGAYQSWDTDESGKIESDEFTIGTFNIYDRNNDGQITIDEWPEVIM